MSDSVNTCEKVVSIQSSSTSADSLKYILLTILSYVNCFIHGEVTGFQVLLDSLDPDSMMGSRWFPSALQEEGC